MKNILVIHQSAELYGSDKTLLLLLTALDKTKFSAVVVLPFSGPLKAELEKVGIKVVVAPVLKLYRKIFSPKNMLQFFKEIKTSIKELDILHKEHKFDLVYSNTLAVLLGMIYARKRNIKHIWHVHEIIVHPKPIAAIFPYLLNKYSDVVVCNSEATKNNLTTRIPSLENKCVVVHNGLAPAINKQNDGVKLKRADLGFTDSDIIITLVGRISRLKGHKWLLNTYLKFLSKSNLKILFVGSPVPGQEYYLADVEQFIADNAIGNNVKIISFTKDLENIWDLTDIAIVPSTEAESFGLVALEAMLAKKPVIASDAGGLKEIVVNNATGILVDASNERKLADAIFQLMESKETRMQFGERGYERAISEFSLNKYIQGMSLLFAEN